MSQLYYVPQIGIPLLRLDVCSESEVTFTCIVNESDFLHWEVDFLSGGEIDRVRYLSTDAIGLDQHANHPVNY